MTARKSHVHKFKRHTYKTGSQIYQCVLDCDYRVAVELAFGKKAICWRCGCEFVLNTYSISLAKPHCEKCHVFKDTRITGDRRKVQNRRTEDHNEMIQSPMQTVAASTGDSVIQDLRSKLNSTTVIKTVTDIPQVIEYKPDDDFLE